MVRYTKQDSDEAERQWNLNVFGVYATDSDLREEYEKYRDEQIRKHIETIEKGFLHKIRIFQ